MAIVARTPLYLINGTIIVLLLLFVPFFIVSGQTEATDTPQVIETPREDFSLTSFGLKPEAIPNGDDVIGDFVVGPGKFEAFMEPGETLTTEIIITNRTGIDRRFNIDVEDATGSSDGSRALVLLGDDRGPYSIKDYLSFPTRTFDLNHGERARIPVTITMPEDAEPGGFYGSALVNTISVPLEQEEREGAAALRSPVIQRIGVLFFITIPGDNVYEGRLQDFEIVPESSWYEKGPFNFVITYENTGASHLNPYGEIRITNMFGEEVGFVELVPWFALPNSVRLREVTWSREMLYGKYTATVAVNRGYEDIVDEMSITFWVVPWKFVALSLAGLFVVFFFIRIFFKTFEFKRKS